MKDDEEMSENDSKLNLDKDDEDFSDSFKNPYNEMNSSGDKAPKSILDAPRIFPKKSPKFTEYLEKFSLFGKHERSFDSSNSSDSGELVKKKKNKDLSVFQKSYIVSQKDNFIKNYNILLISKIIINN